MFTDIKSAKSFAWRLKTALRKIDPLIKLHVCQRITARMCLYNDWHHLEQVIPKKPHLPDHVTVVSRLQQELTLIGLSAQAAPLFGEALSGHANGAPVGEVIIHQNGDFLLSSYGDDTRRLRMMWSYVKSGLPQVVEYRYGAGRWRFKLIPYNAHAPVIVWGLMDDVKGLREIENPPEIIKAALNYNTTWFDEGLLNFVRLAGMDITPIKPAYTDEATATVLSEAYAKLLKSTSQEIIRPVFLAHKLAECFAIALHAITTDRTLLKADNLTDERKWARSFAEGRDYRDMHGQITPHATLLQALSDVELTNHFEVAASVLLNLDPAKIRVANKHYMAPFHFLPSEHGDGCQPSLYGWPGSDDWKERYSSLEGVAVKPPHDPDDFGVILAQKHFEECGVTFLDMSHAQEYLDDAALKWGATPEHWRIPQGLRRPKVSVPQKVAAKIKGVFQGA